MVTRTGGSWIWEFAGLSTDTKPTTDENGKPVPNGSLFREMDTQLVFIYDQANTTWRAFSASAI